MKAIPGYEGSYSLEGYGLPDPVVYSHSRKRLNGCFAPARYLKPFTGRERTPHKRFILMRNNQKRLVGLGLIVLAVREGIEPVIPKGYVVDHIDRNPLNDSPDNLRFLTTGENNRNSVHRSFSSWPGVDWFKRTEKWRARYRDATGKLRHVGTFDDELDAAYAVMMFSETQGLGHTYPVELRDELERIFKCSD